MSNSKKIILSALGTCTFVAVLAFSFVVLNNGNSYNVDGKAKVNGQSAKVEEQTSPTQNNEVGKTSYVEGQKITSNTDLSTIPAPKAGESNFKEGEKPGDSVFYVGPEAGDSNNFEQPKSFASSNANTANVYYYLEPDTGILHINNNSVKSDASYKENNQSGDQLPAWHDQILSVKELHIDGAVKPPSTKSWASPAKGKGWYSSPRVKRIEGLERLDLSGATNTSYMFCGINYDKDFMLDEDNIPKWGVSQLDLSSAVCIDGMFACTGNANKKVFNCAFDENDTVNIKTSASLSSAKAAFQGATLKTKSALDFSSMDLSNVTEAGYMLHNLTNVSSLKMGKADVSKLTYARSMFNNLNAMTLLDLTSWVPTQPSSSTVNYVGMFQNCTNLKSILVPDGFSLSNIDASWSGYMFYGDTSLTGNDGTTLKEALDSTYAKVDFAHTIVGFSADGQPIKTPGYFTAEVCKMLLTNSETAGNKTMTFYHDSVDHSNAGTVYYCPQVAAQNPQDVLWHKESPNVDKVVFDPQTYKSANLAPMDYWFANCTKLTEPPVLPADGDQGIVYSKGLYKDCINLDCIKISSQVVKIDENCFENCVNLKKVVADGINTSSNLDASFTIEQNAFKDCSHLENFVVKNANDGFMDYKPGCFTGCGSANDGPADDPKDSAPFIMAGGKNTKDFAASITERHVKSYTFTPIGQYSAMPFSTDASDASDPIIKTDRLYLYLTNNITVNNGSLKKRDRYISIGKDTDSNAISVVLDLNGFIWNRNCSDKVSYGYSFQVFNDANKNNHHFRVDDTSSLKIDVNNPSTDHVGKITGGKSISGTGAIVAFGECEFVNGEVYNNVEYSDKYSCGGAVTVGVLAPEQGKTGSVTPKKEFDGTYGCLKMYGGAFLNNTVEKYSQTSLCEDSAGGVFVRPAGSFYAYAGIIAKNKTTMTNYGGGVKVRGVDDINDLKLYARMFLFEKSTISNNISNKSSNSGISRQDKYSNITLQSKCNNSKFDNVTTPSLSARYYPKAPADSSCINTYNVDANSLVFYYDYSTHDEDGITSFTDIRKTGGYAYKELPPWFDNETVRTHVKTIKFDKSFKNECNDADPITSVAYWFSSGVSGATNHYDELVSVDFTNFDMRNVTDMYRLVYFPSASEKYVGQDEYFKLKSITFDPNIDTSKVTNMGCALMGNWGVKSIDVSKFNTENVESLIGFINGTGIETLDLSSFKTTKLKNIRNMFYGCKRLKTIYVNKDANFAVADESTGDNWDSCFVDCDSLVGGSGTKWADFDDTKRKKYLYAKIDGGPGNEGFFTLKNPS